MPAKITKIYLGAQSKKKQKFERMTYTPAPYVHKALHLMPGMGTLALWRRQVQVLGAVVVSTLMFQGVFSVLPSGNST